VFSFVRVVAIALSLVSLSVLAGVTGQLAPIPAAISAERDARADHRSTLLDCVNAPATDRLCCNEAAVEVQASVPVRLRDADERPVFAFRPGIFAPRGIPARSTVPPARVPGPALSRFVLFGNFRS